MLKQMRGFTRSWFSRALLIVLGILMSITITQRRMDIMSIFSGFTGPRGVADVAGHDISPQQVSRELDNALKMARQRGQEVSREQAVAQGAPAQILDRMISDRALLGYAEKLGIHADNSQVAEMIRQMPALRAGLSGTFDRQTYDRMLREYGYSEPEFEEEQRTQIEVGMMMQALVDGARAPESFGKLVLAFQSENRVLSLAEAPASLTGPAPTPDAQQLQAFYEDNAARFHVPAYRALTLAYAQISDFAARVNIPEERLHQEFDTRAASLSTPEKRSYVRLAATSQAQANDAVARLGRGEAPDAVARALHMQVVHGNDQARTAIPDASVAAAVFSMAPNAPPRAVPAQLTPWAVVQVTGMTPASAPVYAEQREAIRNALAQDEARDQLDQAVSAYDDARASGASVADAARQHGLTVVTVPAVNAQGMTPDGAPAAPFVDKPELLRLAFETNDGEASEFTPIGDADVVVSVDHVTPAATRPLAQVRPQVLSMWQTYERARKLADLGREIKDAVAHGQSFADAVRSRHLTMRMTSQPFDRQNAARLPSRELGAAVFAARQGDVVTGMAIDGSAMLVAQVEAIRRTDPAQAHDVVEQMRQRMQQGLGQGMFEAITAEARRAGHERRNTALMQQTFAPRNNDQDQPPQ